jgi:hypothetical protein
MKILFELRNSKTQQFKLTFTVFAVLSSVQKRWASIIRAKTAETWQGKITNSTWHWRTRCVATTLVKSNFV